MSGSFSRPLALPTSAPSCDWTARTGVADPRLTASLLRSVHTSRVYEVARETALQAAPRLTGRLRTGVWLKREDQQPIFSFKIRGAYHAVVSLPEAERARGVVAVSAGNHAQGVAYSARHLGMACTIVMPGTTPSIKVDAVRALGADVLLSGERFADAEAAAIGLADERGQAFVHPYDDLHVIQGQATVAAEIVRQRPADLRAIFVPVGGGGLIAGIGVYVKALLPGVKVIGVEPRNSDAMYQALRAGRPVPIACPGPFADGVAVQQVGRHVFPLAQATVDEVIRVSDERICAAMRTVFEETRGIVEPAGALGVAGIEAYVEREGPRTGGLVAVLTGANVNFDLLGWVADQSRPLMATGNREAR